MFTSKLKIKTSLLRWPGLSLSGNQFHIAGPATEKARRRADRSWFARLWLVTIKCAGPNKCCSTSPYSLRYSRRTVCGGVAMRKSAKLSLFVDNFQTVNVVYNEVLSWLFVIICMSLSISLDVWRIFSVYYVNTYDVREQMYSSV